MTEGMEVFFFSFFFFFSFNNVILLHLIVFPNLN